MLPMEMVDGIPVLLPKGRFDAYQVDEINASMESIFADMEKPQVIVNLVQVHFIGSPAVDVLTEWLNKAREKGGDVVIASLRQTMRMRLKIQSLMIFMMYDDVEQAVEAFKNSDGDEA